nr:uncharacterized protein LOC117861868 [Setaria viridis]
MNISEKDIQKLIWFECILAAINKMIRNSDEVNKYVLNNVPADESSDISHKEQLALCLRYVDKTGRPCEHFIGVVHVDDTTSLSLKEAIEGLLICHGLTMTQIRGQGYDGANNMKGDIKGLNTLIMQESPSVYYIHCFAHQLQLVLVAVAKRNADCKSFFDQVSILLNIIGVSCKQHGVLRTARLENIKKALECGELESGSGLNQEMSLPRPGETRWGSHYKTICSIITMYSSIHDALIDLGDDISHKDDWTKIHFRRDQDILNAISLVNVTKNKMQQLKSDGWDHFLERVTSFCIKYDVEVPAMDGDYVPYGKSARPEQVPLAYVERKICFLFVLSQFTNLFVPIMTYFFCFTEQICLFYLLFESSLMFSIGMRVFLLFPTTIVFVFVERYDMTFAEGQVQEQPPFEEEYSQFAEEGKWIRRGKSDSDEDECSVWVPRAMVDTERQANQDKICNCTEVESGGDGASVGDVVAGALGGVAQALVVAGGLGREGGAGGLGQGVVLRVLL